jgi:hypothetical protein
MRDVTGRFLIKAMGFMIRIALLPAIKREIRTAGRIKGVGRAQSFGKVEDVPQPAIGWWRGGKETRSSEFPKGQDGGRFQTCYLEASAHQAVNRERRQEMCARRVVPGEFAERDETCFGKRLSMPGIFLERIQILGLHTNEAVSCQKQRLVRAPGFVRRQDNKTGDIEAGR